MEDLTAEISGPTMASFQQMFAESNEDFLSILFGIVSVQNYCENNDERSKTEKNRCKVMVKNWVIINFEDAMDCKTGELNRSALKSLVQGKTDLQFVGFLRFLNVKNVDYAPSFLDRKLMSAVLQSCSWEKPKPKPHVYIMVWAELTAILSRKYTMTTFLLEHTKECIEGPWCRKIPLVVPNLGMGQRVQYVEEFEIGSSVALSEMLSEADLGECISFDLESKFQHLNTKFVSCMDVASENIIQLEVSRINHEMEVTSLEQKITEQNLVSREMKAVRGLLSDLKSALEVDLYENLTRHVDNNIKDNSEVFSTIQENEVETMPMVPVELSGKSIDKDQSISELETMPIDTERVTKSTEKQKCGELKEKRNVSCDLSMKLVLSEEEDLFSSP